MIILDFHPQNRALRLLHDESALISSLLKGKSQKIFNYLFKLKIGINLISLTAFAEYILSIDILHRKGRETTVQLSLNAFSIMQFSVHN